MTRHQVGDNQGRCGLSLQVTPVSANHLEHLVDQINRAKRIGAGRV